MACREAGMRIWVQLFGGPHPYNFGGPITSKICRDFGQIQILIANISGMDKSIDKLKTKTALLTAILFTFDEKKC